MIEMLKSQQIKMHWRDWLMLLFGVWLVASPFAFGHAAAGAGMVMWAPVLLGVAVIVFAVAVLRKTQVWEEWILFALGMALIAAPFLLGYAGVTLAMWNSVVMGLLVGVDAGWSLFALTHHGKKAA
ncbi:SPW repeat protein [Halomonas salifodinae]|uniref:SPW repeat protein n=1 Tax=Halomonas salifodinae TaxID=438745 RepID=A0ABW2ESY6_9GAMM